MKKAIAIQAPKKFYEAVPIFYQEAEKFGFFDKFYIATDFEGPHDVGDNCVVHVVKKDKQFSSNMLSLLPTIEESIFFVCCEDHILKGPNNLELWQQCWDFALHTSNAGFIRLTKNGRVQLTNHTDFIAPIKKKDRYYISLQPAIWRKGYLKYALQSGEDAWKFEINGTARVRTHSKFISYCVQQTIFHRTNFYKSGRYYRHKFAEYIIQNGGTLKTDKKIDWKGKHLTFEEYLKVRRKGSPNVS